MCVCIYYILEYIPDYYSHIHPCIYSNINEQNPTEKRQQKLLKFVQSSSGCSQSPIAYQLPRADSAASVNRLLIMNVYNTYYM